MRLLQLATGPGEMIDLHPHVTVVTGLDAAGRQLLADAVTGLASGRAVRAAGLLEAHGVLFDLGPAELAMLDIDAADVAPVVTADDLPTLHHAPPTPERTAAEQALAELEARWDAASERDVIAQSALVAATAAVEQARQAAEQAAEPAVILPSREELAVQHAEASAQVRRLSEELAGIVLAVEEASAARVEVETATAAALVARQAAAVHCSEVAARLDAARIASDPDAGPAVRAAAEQLEATQAAVDAEREAEELAAQADGEPPADRLARVEAELEAVERKLAVFGPADVDRVADELEPIRALDDVAPVPDALDLAAELAELEDDLRAQEPRDGEPLSGDRGEARARLDVAHEALVDAEQAVRSPELDRDLVDRLELAHADLLDAVERAEGRFAGGRAERRVEACRADENAILDELGLASYSEYMMGSAMHHVDPVKELTLEAARSELAAAEDAWRALDEETDAELARAQQMERRRTLLEDARGYLGGAAAPGSVIEELRALRVDAEPSAEVMVDLRRALDEAGVVVGDEDLDRDDLLLVAEAWISEVGEAASRERSLRAELADLLEQRADAEAALRMAGGTNGSSDLRSTEEHRIERLELAREQLRVAEERHQAHLEAEQEATSLVDELAAAAERERTAVEAAATAEAAVAAAAMRESDATAARDWVEAELAAAELAEAETAELLQTLDDTPREGADDVPSLASAEEAYALAVATASDAADEVSDLAAECNRARRELAALSDSAPPQEEVAHLAEEVEWYLLARLAAQRSVSLGGSLPLVLDDALIGLPQEDMEHVLGRLERMSEAVQVIVISDDPATAAWVALAGEDRAAVVRPQADSMV